MNTLLSDASGDETKPWSDESEKTKILAILDDPREMENGRQKELNSLKEVGAMTAVKRSERVGKRVIQMRWVRSRDGRVCEVQADSERLQSKQRAHPARDLFTTPSTVSLQTMLAVSSHDRNNHPECDHITIEIDSHTAFCTRTLTKNCLQSHQKLTNGMSQSCAKTKFGN